MKMQRRTFALFISIVFTFIVACQVNAGDRGPMTKKDVIDAQQAWGDAIVSIGRDGGDSGPPRPFPGQR